MKKLFTFEKSNKLFTLENKKKKTKKYSHLKKKKKTKKIFTFEVGTFEK